MEPTHCPPRCGECTLTEPPPASGMAVACMSPLERPLASQAVTTRGTGAETAIRHLGRTPVRMSEGRVRPTVHARPGAPSWSQRRRFAWSECIWLSLALGGKDDAVVDIGHPSESERWAPIRGSSSLIRRITTWVQPLPRGDANLVGRPWCSLALQTSNTSPLKR